MRHFFIRVLVLVLACGCMPLAMADYDDENEDQAYQNAVRQQRGSYQAQELHETLVPIVRMLFDRNKQHTDVYMMTPPQGAYNYQPVLNNGNFKTLPANSCYHQQDGILRQVPCAY